MTGCTVARSLFQGGRREEEDPDLQATALREFHEETGASTTGLMVLGALSSVYIPPSRSLVTPFVAHTYQLGPLAPDAREVAALIEAPLATLLDPDVLRRRHGTGDGPVCHRWPISMWMATWYGAPRP